MAKSVDGVRNENIRRTHVSILGDLEGETRKKENAIKNNKHNRFFSYGRIWCLQGKELEEGLANNQEFKFETEQDIIDFKTGYINAKYYRLGYDTGFEGTKIEEVPLEYLKTDSFDRLELQKVSLFKKGYDDGFKQFSKLSDDFFKLGEKGEMLDKLPLEFKQNRKFIFSYRDGLKLYQERENSQFRKNVR